MGNFPNKNHPALGVPPFSELEPMATTLTIMNHHHQPHVSHDYGTPPNITIFHATTPLKCPGLCVPAENPERQPVEDGAGTVAAAAALLGRHMPRLRHAAGKATVVPFKAGLTPDFFHGFPMFFPMSSAFYVEG